jgi:hypothetical protein
MNYRKKFIVFILFISNLNAQNKNETYSKILKSDAVKMANALLEKDYNMFCDYTYPQVVKMVGGKQKMMNTLKTATLEMEKEGYSFLKVTIGEPTEIFISKNELQATITQELEMKVPEGKLVTISTLIAISTTKGKKWHFIDASNKNISELRKALPSLSKELIIPIQSKPVFYKE